MAMGVLLGDLLDAASSCPFWLGYVGQCCVKFLGNDLRFSLISYHTVSTTQNQSIAKTSECVCDII